MFKFSDNFTLSFDLTTKCNLSCKHCRTEEVDYSLSLDEIKCILDNCKDFHPKIAFLSGGEPLVREDIIDVVKLIKKEIPVICLNTNGTLLDEVLLKSLIDSGVNYIQISLDGTQKIHDFIRGDGTYNKTLESIRLVSRYSKLVKLHISCAISKFNIDNMEELAAMLLESEAFNIDILGFKRFIPKNDFAGKYNLGKDGLQKLSDTIDYLSKKYKLQTKVCADFPLKNIKNADNAYKIMEKYDLPCVGCSAPLGGPCIRAVGSVSPCSMIELTAGNLLKEKLIDIYSTDLFQDLANRKLSGKCGQCKHKMICGGCRASAYQINHDCLSEDPECYIND